MLMENIEVDIPKIKALNDFTIIYKGREEHEGQIIENIEEIKTSKEDFLSKLRYFKSKIHEIDQQKEIFIHDIYPNQIFKEFITALTTDKITLNETNYSYLHQLSIKFGYEELCTAIEKYCETRPDINRIMDSISQNSKNKKEMKEEEEEIISKHLDICLQNDNMLNIKIENLNRILNSPKRILNNHHLLFKFVKKIIEKYRSKKNSNNGFYDDENEKYNIQVLVGSLDLSLMSNDELNEILEKEEISEIFGSRGSKDKMKNLLKENEKQEERIKSLVSHIDELEQLIKSTFSKQEEISQQRERKLNEQIETQIKIINENKEEIKKTAKLH